MRVGPAPLSRAGRAIVALLVVAGGLLIGSPWWLIAVVAAVAVVLVAPTPAWLQRRMDDRIDAYRRSRGRWDDHR